MEASIQEVARLAGTTSRTLRHYDAIGLLPPTRIGHQGYRYYDAAALVRLQRILLLRDLGLGLEQIRQVLDAQTDEVGALRTHLAWLEAETDRLAPAPGHGRADHHRTRGREQSSWRTTCWTGSTTRSTRTRSPSAGAPTPTPLGDAWWRGMTEAERSDVEAAPGGPCGRLDRGRRCGGADPASARPRRWPRVTSAGSPTSLGPRSRTAGQPSPTSLGLGDMYVADPRFAKNYGGVDGAAFVRDALRLWAESHRA